MESVKISSWVHPRIFLPGFRVDTSDEVILRSTEFWSLYSSWTLMMLLILPVFVYLSAAARRRRVDKFPPGPRNIVGFFGRWWKIFLFNDISLIPGGGLIQREEDRIIGVSNILQRRDGVLIGDFALLKEAFKNPAILGRPSTFYLQMFPGTKNKGLLMGWGSSWKEIHRFMLSHLKNAGAGHKCLGPVIAEQAFEIVTTLRTKVNQPFSTHNFFNVPVFSVLWNMISSQKLEPGNPQAQKMVHIMDRASPYWLLAFILSNYRLGRLLHWLLVKTGLCPFFDYIRDFRQLASEVIENRKADPEFQTGRNSDFLDSFLLKIQTTKETTSAFYGQNGYENLSEFIRDMFLAGTETTASTMSWALLFLALHPDKQEKLQREIDTVLEGRTPTLYDRSKMKYTTAVINETLRKSSSLPFGVPHRTTEDTRIGKFEVPKDTTVVSNIYAIHHCKKTWGDAFVFRPERFLSEDGSTLIKYEEFIPFGCGKRMCLGASMAMDQLFMLITIIFREFSVTWNPAEPKPGMGTKLGFSIAPLPHTLIITERKKEPV